MFTPKEDKVPVWLSALVAIVTTGIFVGLSLLLNDDAELLWFSLITMFVYGYMRL